MSFALSSGFVNLILRCRHFSLCHFLCAREHKRKRVYVHNGTENSSFLWVPRETIPSVSKAERRKIKCHRASIVFQHFYLVALQQNLIHVAAVHFNCHTYSVHWASLQMDNNAIKQSKKRPKRWKRNRRRKKNLENARQVAKDCQQATTRNLLKKSHTIKMYTVQSVVVFFFSCKWTGH